MQRADGQREGLLGETRPQTSIIHFLAGGLTQWSSKWSPEMRTMGNIGFGVYQHLRSSLGLKGKSSWVTYQQKSVSTKRRLFCRQFPSPRSRAMLCKQPQVQTAKIQGLGHKYDVSILINPQPAVSSHQTLFPVSGQHPGLWCLESRVFPKPGPPCPAFQKQACHRPASQGPACSLGRNGASHSHFTCFRS